MKDVNPTQHAVAAGASLALAFVAGGLTVYKVMRDRERRPNKKIRLWMDGCFDMFHYGHANAFRQARSLGDYLVVGVNSQETVTEAKGPPVMSEEERLAAVEGCRFVDLVVPSTPYVMTEEYLAEVIQKYDIDFVVHGDDPCLVDGKDVFASAKAAGKYKEVPRTEGVSTTDIVGRMLLMSKDHHSHVPNTPRSMKERKPSRLSEEVSGASEIKYTKPQAFLTKTSLLRQFSPGHVAKPGDKIVYMDGAWDMFHCGHVETLKAAKAQGDYLIVGVHNDDVVNQHRGLNYPIMNLLERVLSALSCKYVDDVLIDAPWALTKEVIQSLNISVVVHGTKNDANLDREEDPYKIPKEMGIYKELPSVTSLSAAEIVERIQANKDRFVAKYQKKAATESEFYEQKYGN